MGSDRYWEYQNSLPSELAAARAKLIDAERELQQLRATLKRLEEWARDIDEGVADAAPMELSMNLADVAAALRQTIRGG